MSIPYLCGSPVPYGRDGCLTLIFKADLLPSLIDEWAHHWRLHIHHVKPPVMNEYVLYQPCITSWSIVLFHPTNLSFSQGLINHGCDSVSNYDLIANQSTPRLGRTLRAVWPMHIRVRTHIHTQTVSVISRHFFWDSGIMGKFVTTLMASLGTAVLAARCVWSSDISQQLLDGLP